MRRIRTQSIRRAEERSPALVCVVVALILFIICIPPVWTETFRLEPAFPRLSFTRPVDLQHAGDGTNRLFVLEQAGVIRVFQNISNVASAPIFLDIREKVNDRGNEEGLLGLAFHPRYKENGYFYLDYTAAKPRRTIIARYRVRPNDPSRADPESEVVLLEIPQPYSNHNGGQIVFGPEGYLYIALGDGGSAGDPYGHAQNRKTLLGSLLRIDINAPSHGRPYSIPKDNPFVGNDAGFRDEIYAYGLRNPWRFSIDPVTKRLWLADVGQNRIEEVNIIEKGKNYGWNILEGSRCYRPPSGCKREGLVLPVAEYTHSVGRSITGGFVYRGSGVPALKGSYVYADFATGRLWSLRHVQDTPSTPEEILDSDLNIASFGVDENNELLLCAFDGKIYRFQPTAASQARSHGEQ